MSFALFGPTQAASSAKVGLLPQPQKSGGNFVYSFTQPAGVSGVSYHADWRADLGTGSWISINDTGSGATHVFSVPIEGNGKMFVRLRVSSP
jgi:hypothetical protein